MGKLVIKDRRTKQQKAYKSFRMARCGTMTQETEKEWRKCETRISKDNTEFNVADYAAAMGWSVEYATYKVGLQKALLNL